MHMCTHTLSHLIKKCNFLINFHIKPNTPSRLVCYGTDLDTKSSSLPACRGWQSFYPSSLPPEKSGETSCRKKFWWAKSTDDCLHVATEGKQSKLMLADLSKALPESGEGKLQAHLRRLLYFILQMGAFTSLKIIGFLLIICNLNISLNSRIQYYDCFLSA